MIFKKNDGIIKNLFISTFPTEFFNFSSKTSFDFESIVTLKETIQQVNLFLIPILN